MSTGLTTLRCYASPLEDCDGQAATHEHFVSKGLLERLGPSLTVSGLSWMTRPMRLGSQAITARVLCKRHNEALSALDAEVCKLFDALEAVHRGEQIGARTLNGELLERWSLKVLAGLVSSGNAGRKDGQRLKSDVPDEYLSVLFGSAVMPEGWGFHVFLSPKARHANQVEIIPNTYPDGPQEGLLYGVTVMIFGLYYSTIMTGVTITKSDEQEPDQVWYRPQGIELDGLGRLNLEWQQTPSQEIVAPHAWSVLDLLRITVGSRAIVEPNDSTVPPDQSRATRTFNAVLVSHRYTLRAQAVSRAAPLTLDDLVRHRLREMAKINLPSSAVM